MGVITEEQFQEIWADHGLQGRMFRFRGWLLERGLLPHVTEDVFAEHMEHVLKEFFVNDRVEKK